MTTQELRDVLTAFSRVAGTSFWEWREAVIAQETAANGTNEETEWQAQLASWQRTLADVSYDEASAIVRQMELGRLDVPPYGELARTIRAEAVAARRAPDTDGRRYECALCRDNGMVEVWNPLFVHAYRAEFESLQATRVSGEHHNRLTGEIYRASYWSVEPANWLGMAYRWWRGQARGPMRHMALCTCSCRRQQVLAGELRAYRDGTRSTRTNKAAGPPACGVVQYDPARMPLATADRYEDLRAWYAMHADPVTTHPNYRLEFLPYAQ
jgi:hypothetical protein